MTHDYLALIHVFGTFTDYDGGGGGSAGWK